MLMDLMLPSRLQGLFELGDIDSLRDFQGKWQDYVSEFQLTAADTPTLVGILELWFHWHRENDFPEEPLAFAPIHAWRALGQLQAVEALEPMLDNLDLLDEQMDDWSMEDWPVVFGLMGPPVIESLINYLRNQRRREFSRDVAAGGLMQIARRHSDRHAQVVQVLSDQLARHESLAVLNGSILGKLLDLEAVESAEVIERAFAAEVIDESLCGCWMEVREKLGVEGLGITPLRPRTPRSDFFFPGDFLLHTSTIPSVKPISAVNENRKRPSARPLRNHENATVERNDLTPRSRHSIRSRRTEK